MTNCLVTGTPGWLGATLLRRLLKTDRTIRLLIDPAFAKIDLRAALPPFNGREVDLNISDLRDYETVKKSLVGIDTVFHLAAVQHPKKIADFYSINSDASAELARMAAAAGAKRFVFVSSCSVEGSSEEATNESTPLRGYTHYTQSKIKAEQLLQKVAADTGIEIVIIRPGVFYGVAASVNMKRLLFMVQNKPLPVFGKDGFRRTYVDVEKVAEALVLAEERGAPGSAYLIGDIEPLTTVQLYQILADALGCRPKIVALPVFISRAAEFCTFQIGNTLGMHIPMGNVLGEFGRPTFFKSNKAASIGFEPLASPRPGLAEMARSYLQAK